MRGGNVHYRRPLVRWLALSGILTITLTGCFNSGNNTQGLGSRNGNSGPITVKIWRAFDSEEAFSGVVSAFNDRNPNVKLEYRMIPIEEYELTVSEALAAGNGPDIWSIRNDWVPRHKDKLVPMPEGLLADKAGAEATTEADKVSSAFVPVVANDVVQDGRAYGLPLSLDTLVIYRNRSILNSTMAELEAARKREDARFLQGTYTTWDELQYAAFLLTKRNGATIERGGLAAGTSNNVSRAEDVVAAMMLQNGTPMVAQEKTNATFQLPQTGNTGQQTYPGTEALKRYAVFADPASDYYSWNASMPNDVQAFIDGKTAMFFGYQYHQLLFQQTAPLLQYDTVPFPQIRDTSTPVDYASYWVEGVTKNADDPELAWQIVKKLAFDYGTNYRQATGRPAPFPYSEYVSVLDRAGKTNPLSFQQATAQSWYKTKRPDRIDQIFREMIQEVGTKQTAPQNAIEAAAKRVSTQLEADQQ